MSYTQVQICNLALTRMGHTEVIQVLTEKSEAAYNCNRLYDPSLRAALEAFPWDFARVIVDLALLSETPDDYDYAYTIPSDCVRPLYILPEQDPPIVFRRRGSTLYTDAEDAQLAYTSYVDNPAEYTALFAQSFSYLLASDLAIALASDLDLQSRMIQLATGAVNEAKASDAQVGKKTSTRYSDIVSARA